MATILSIGKENSGLYPVQKRHQERIRQEILSKLSRKLDEKKKRRSSVFAISVKQNPERRMTATTFLSTWRAISIEATLEKEVAVEMMDTLLKNFQMGVYDQAKKARNFNVKVMWLILVIVMHVLLIYELANRSIQYYYNPVITTFNLHTPRSIDFPQVYICMASSVNMTFMWKHPKEWTLSNKFRERIVLRRKRSIETEETDDRLMGEMEEYLARHLDLMRRSPREIHDHNGRESYLGKQNDNSTFDAYDFFHDAGYTVEETFLECSFGRAKKEKLNCKDIVEPILDINYGLCYAVNLGMQQSDPGAGLTIILHSHVDLYPLDDVNAPRSSGIYVSVSNQYDPTNWQKACASPGQFLKIDLKSTRVQMLNLDSGILIQPCVEDSVAANLLEVFNATYSRTTCQMDCMLKEIRDHCQCTLIMDKRVLRSEVVADTTFCTPNQSQLCILPRVTHNSTAKANMEKCRTKCHTPCNSWHFDMRTSVAPLYPPAFSRFGLRPNVTRKNVIRVDVSYSAIEYGELVQSSSLTASIFISDIGGLMNLWINTSIVTLVSTMAIVTQFCLWKLSRWRL